MFARIWSAFGRIADGAGAVADALHSLAATFRSADEHARSRLGLDGPAPPPELIESEAPKGGKKKAGAA